MSDTTPENINICIRFLLERVVQKYNEFQDLGEGVDESQANGCPPERLIDICEFIILALYETHPDEVRNTLFLVTIDS